MFHLLYSFYINLSSCYYVGFCRMQFDVPRYVCKCSQFGILLNWHSLQSIRHLVNSGLVLKYGTDIVISTPKYNVKYCKLTIEDFTLHSLKTIYACDVQHIFVTHNISFKWKLCYKQLSHTVCSYYLTKEHIFNDNRQPTLLVKNCYTKYSQFC